MFCRPGHEALSRRVLACQNDEKGGSVYSIHNKESSVRISPLKVLGCEHGVVFCFWVFWCEVGQSVSQSVIRGEIHGDVSIVTRGIECVSVLSLM